MSLEKLRSVKCVAEICEKIDKSILPYRNSVIEDAVDEHVLDKLLDEIVQLQSKQNCLDQYFNINNLPSLERLKEIKLVLDEKNWWSWFFPKWYKSLTSLRSFSKNKKEKDYNIASARVNELVHNQISIERLAKNSDYHSILTNLFQGIHTNQDHLKNIISFYKILRDNILGLPHGIKICTALKNTDRVIFDWLSKNKDVICDGFEKLDTANSLLLSKGEKSDSSLDMVVVLDKLKRNVSEFRKIKKNFDDIKLPMTINLGLLKEMNKLNESLKKAKSEFENDEVAQKLNLSLDKDVLENHKNLLDKLHNIAVKAAQNLPAVALKHVLCSEGFKYLQSIKKLVNSILIYLDAQKSLLLHIPDILNFKDFWHTQECNEEIMLNSIVKKLTEIDSNDLSFNKWCDITNSLAEAEKEGMYETIISFIKATDPQVLFSDYVPLYKYLTYNTLSDKVLHQNKILGSFSRFDHENTRNSFKLIDIELQKLNSQMLYHRISRKNIPNGSGGRSPKSYTDQHLILHEISKQRAHIPIRQLVKRAYGALTALKPCFMMGPLSVSKYLDPSNEKFDVLIMDEASQIKPENAISILARTNQVVVVGDSNQLPPTNFFEKTGDEGDNDDDFTPVEDSESILDVCKPLFQPIRRLRWHYRSQHQSLISFSNNHFYDGDLIIFPSPAEHSDSMGVKHIYVGDGIYSNQTNVKEAKFLVDDIMQMIKQYPKRTYGIVTLNSKQKIVIEDLIDSFRKKNSTFDNYMLQTEKTDEDLFVKSIENVQGDERDVIYISVTFGPNDSGVFHQKFGPINGKNGWRRLNVLFTRAKQHIRIFSSFYGKNIRVDDTKEQRGLRALRDYLQFAETGIDNHSHLTEKEPDSDFERAVGSFLIKERYEIVYQLGVAGYFVDIVVKHPENSNYIIAIECDGATYHSAKSARDRDRLREDNLRNLGWGNIHRIWSTDWFKNRKTEEARLLKAITTAIEANNNLSSKIR
ncbi:MAG: hypothetical protein DBO98_03255 [Candidatus Liberibacter europaeus]|nr:hypothetical protein [Candidatus Liberibacter europaeus]